MVAVVSACCFSQRSQAQLPEFEKYAKLKKRLNETFVKVGPLAGESIPANRLYNKWDDHTNRYYLNLEFGDATIHLGWYLAVLATENRLLREHKKNTDENLKELYYALHALERLDRNSDLSWSYARESARAGVPFDTVSGQWISKKSVSTAPDGFFIRDDVPPYFYRHFKGVETVTSDFIQHANPQKYNTDRLGGEESKDQLVSVLFGLFFVNRFVAPEQTYMGTNLVDYNRTITQRIMDFVRNKRLNKTGAWKISNPGKNFEHPRMGYDPVLFSYPLAAMANEIVYNKTFDKRSAVQYFKDITPPNYQNNTSLLTKQVFVRLRETKVVLDKRYDWHINYYMIFMLASASNVWTHDLAYEKNCVDLLKQRCSDQESKGWLIYPLVNYVLYPDGEMPYPKSYVEQELKLYPENGSYNYFNTRGDSLGRYTHKWFSSNRFQSSNGHYEGNAAVDCNSYFNGAFNGLDYMLLYNLYRIAYADYLKDEDYKSYP